MKKVLYIFVLLFCLTVISSAKTTIMVISGSGAEAGACGSSGFYDENFSAPGFCNAQTGNSIEANQTLDDDNQELGSYALKIVYNQAAGNGDCFSYDNYTEQAGDFYISFQFYITDTTNNTTTDMIWFQDGGTAPQAAGATRFSVRETAGPTYTLYAYDGANSQTAVIAYSTLYTVKVFIDDTSQEVDWCLDGGAFTNDLQTSVTQTNRAYDSIFYGDSDVGMGASDAGTFWIKNVVMSTTDIIGFGDCSAP